MTPGYMEGRSVVVISFRPDPGKFATINYAISGTQFKRLIKDGLRLLELSDQLKQDAEPLDPDAPIPVPPKKGRRMN
jgi:hypothetical protein